MEAALPSRGKRRMAKTRRYFRGNFIFKNNE
jgi:hypothetical protein